MIIFSHRGLEPTRKDFYPESSYESFLSQAKRGFGLEFDPNFIRDEIVISHDSNLKRITKGKDERDFSELTINEIKNIRYGEYKKGRIATLDEILDLIREKGKGKINALHLKGKFQNHEKLNLLIGIFKKHQDIVNKILVFDLKPEAARHIKKNLSGIHLALSVAHPYDIKRYNQTVSNTLFSIEDALEYKKENIYDWVWLDEWDLADENNNKKRLYTKEVFEKLKNSGYKIALVTPELHGTSPGLLGAESHEDAKDKETLFRRIKEIINLNPDAVCTDYPKEVLKI